MAPRNKRKRQASHTSSSAHISQSLGSHNRTFKRPPVPSQTSSQRGSIDFNLPSQTSSHGNPRHDAVDNDEVNEDLEQVVMAIDRQRKGTLGCAYYSAREEKLYYLQDLANGTMETIETCESFV
jgi:DNA mismatch repair protein MSH5